MCLAEILNRNTNSIAFIVGNGINRYNAKKTGNSWHDLLMELWKKYGNDGSREIPDGISTTEFYDVLDLVGRHGGNGILQKSFCDLMSGWKPGEHHKKFISWAIDNRTPVLTTNFENTLSEAGDCRVYSFPRNGGFTDYYPWETYYAPNELSDPLGDFAIWHINGMQKYHRSIRLGLTHYMGSVHRVRNWIRAKNGLYKRNGKRDWIGTNTWLKVIFGKKIVIFGLSLDETEVFLRWLLIERAKYFSKYTSEQKDAWYFYVGEEMSKGKELFLSSLGVHPVKCSSYETIYLEPWRF